MPLSDKVKKLVRLALLMTAALMLSYVESVISLNFVVPGVRIGIGNVFLTYVLYEYGFPTAAGFGLTRSVLSLIFLGRLSSVNLFSDRYGFCRYRNGRGEKIGNVFHARS